MTCSDLLFKSQVFTFSSKLYSLSRFLSVESRDRSISLQIRVHSQQQMRFTDTFWNIQHAENGDLLQRSDSYMLLSAGAIRNQGCIAFLKEVPINSVSHHTTTNMALLTHFLITKLCQDFLWNYWVISSLILKICMKTLFSGCQLNISQITTHCICV